MTVAVLFLASFHIALAVLAGPLNLYGVVQVNGANVAPNTLLDLTATSAPPCYFADVHPNVDHRAHHLLTALDGASAMGQTIVPSMSCACDFTAVVRTSPPCRQEQT